MVPSRSGPIDRVRKLRRLAGSSEPYEAKSAAEEAQAMMAGHGMTEEDIAEDVTEMVSGTCHDQHSEDLARIVAVARGCAVLVNMQRTIAFRGHPRVVREARELYQMLAAEAELSSQMSFEGNPPAAAREVWRLCWWLGYNGAVAERLLTSQRTPDDTAAVHNTADTVQTPHAHSRRKVATTIAQATAAFEVLAANLAHTVPNVSEVLERLRQRGYAMGQWLGKRVTIGNPPFVERLFLK